MSQFDREHPPASTTPVPAGDPGTGAAAREGTADPRLDAARRLARHGVRVTAVDRLAELAAQLLGTASAQVSLIADEQEVVGGFGAAEEHVGSRSPATDSLCTVTVLGGEPLVVPDAVADDRVAALPPVTSGVVGAYLGVPLRAEDGHPVGALCVFDDRPHPWSAADVTLLERLAAPVVAELELAALTAELRNSQVVRQLAVDAAQVGTFDWDVVTGALTWDDRLLELFGLDAESFGGTIESFTEHVHPDDRARVEEDIRHSVRSCGLLSLEYRVVLPDGEVRWVAARGRSLPGPDGRTVRMVGGAFDTTEVREGEARVARVLEAMPTAFFALDTSWRFTYVNSEAERAMGLSRHELVGADMWEVFPAAVGGIFETSYRHALDSGEPVSFEVHYPAPLERSFEFRAWPTPDGLSVYFNDVTERYAAQRLADEAAARNALLSRVGNELVGTLDVDDAIGRLAPLVVPELADWCLATLLTDERTDDWVHSLRDVGAWHADPDLRDLVQRYGEVRLGQTSDFSVIPVALAATDPIVLNEGAAAAVAAVLEPGEARDLTLQLDPAAVAVVGLRGRDRALGFLTVFRGAGRGPFTEADLGTLTEVAARAGLALDNAQLFAAQRELAEALQRSLLTPPPQPDDLEITVRYVPAAAAAEVGGDWYDAFLQPSGSTVLVIGDVVGHDPAAAAVMGQVRSLLRGIAVYGGRGPAEILEGVDAAMQTLEVEIMATALVATLEQTPEERRAGVTRLRWSNAGHLPVLLVEEDGTVSTLSGATTDLLLGLDPDEPRSEEVRTVSRGVTVLLCTDGLVERRTEHLDVGLARLREALEELTRAGLTLDEVCDEVLRRLLPERPEDDVALVAVRLHAQDG